MLGEPATWRVALGGILVVAGALVIATGGYAPGISRGVDEHSTEPDRSRPES